MAVRAIDDKASDTLVVVSGEGFWTGSSTLPHLHHFFARGSRIVLAGRSRRARHANTGETRPPMCPSRVFRPTRPNDGSGPGRVSRDGDWLVHQPPGDGGVHVGREPDRPHLGLVLRGLGGRPVLVRGRGALLSDGDAEEGTAEPGDGGRERRRGWPLRRSWS